MNLNKKMLLKMSLLILMKLRLTFMRGTKQNCFLNYHFFLSYLDYNPANVPSTVFIPASSLSICFVSNSIIDDQIALEFDETFSLSIDQAGPDSGGQITIANGSTVIIIVDDDGECIIRQSDRYRHSQLKSGFFFLSS